MEKKILIDIMEHGRFICQLKYDGYPFPEMIDGEVKPVYDSEDIKKFVYSQRPSLVGRDIRIEYRKKKA